jgi:hypothetical protein
MEQEVNDFHREDHYAAQIAAVIKNAFYMGKTPVTTEDMLIKFVKKEPEEKLVGRDKMNAAKRFFLAGVGLKAGD